ncbi:phage holin family protein [Paracoccus pacificus]|uniref:Phage holin family protein n=1 Tax=Paracoccus pacificus TaxID=1463598 RepID=A0ABW4R768_9RHOB
MKLALADTARRTGIKAAAGVVAAIGAGFLIAALWTFLARREYLDWGPLWASVAVGGVFVVVALIVMSMAGRVRHQPPSVDDLRDEMQTRVNLAMSRAADQAEAKVYEFANLAENKVKGLVDSVGFKANDLANRAERKVESLTRDAGETVVRATGMSPETVNMLGSFGKRAAVLPPLIGAFMIGMKVAERVQDWRYANQSDDDDYDDDYDGDYDDDDVAEYAEYDEYDLR